MKNLIDKVILNPLAVLFLVAFIIRVLFSFYFQQFYFGDFQFKYGDGDTYLNPIVNFINNGEYRGDLFIDDSRYFRTPTYPIFLGIIYLLVPTNFFEYIVAGIQCIFGSLSVLLAYSILMSINLSRRVALISAFIFAMYPFSILWTPLIYTETLQIFLIFLLIFFANRKRELSAHSFIIQGILVGLIILIKQYLGLIIIIPLSIILFSTTYALRVKVIHISLLMLGLLIVVGPWVIRNNISSTNTIIFFGQTSGLRNALDDMVAFTQFANKFDENTNKHVNSVVEAGIVKFTRHNDFLITHENDIALATQLAYQCGGSFLERRNPTLISQPPHQNCNKELIPKFDKLSLQFWREVPLWEALETRRDALWKVVTKSDFVNKNLIINKNYSLKYFLFKYRILLLILGLVGVLYLLLNKTLNLQQKVLAGSMLVTAIAFYLFFCVILVSAEMRYLLTPDLLISLFAGVVPVVIFRKILSSL